VEKSPAEKIDSRIREYDDWRGAMLEEIRQLIHAADPQIVEEWKWERPSTGGVPVWSHDGGICTGEIYKEVVKLTFFKGASLKDPKGLFNSSLAGNVRRAIDIREGTRLNKTAFKALIKEAVVYNKAAVAQKRAAKKK
jgi:hypothetical protein